MKLKEKKIKLLLPEFCPDPCHEFNPQSDIEKELHGTEPFTDKIVARCANEPFCTRLIEHYKSLEENKGK